MVNDFKTRLYDEVQSNALAATSVVNELEVSVVIPCLNESQSIGFCIDKALTAFRDHGIRGEVLVSDNGSTDGSVAYVQQLCRNESGRQAVTLKRNLGGRAFNAGLRLARGRFLHTSENDIEYLPGWDAELLGKFEAFPELG